MGLTLMLIGKALVGVGVRCLGVGVATPGWQVRRTTPARGAVPGARTNDSREKGRPSRFNTTHDARQTRGCGFTYTRVRWAATELRLEGRAVRDGLPGSAKFAAATKIANDGG
jgi:hypothetical protein